MENPFEIIIEKLNAIELLVRRLESNHSGPSKHDDVLDVNKAAEYLYLSKSTLYKLTSQREIPHFKTGKRLFFKRSELNDWMTINKISSKEDIDKMANSYILSAKRRRFSS